MNERPILVNISRNVDDDIIQVISDNGDTYTQNGIIKYVPQSRIDCTFRELISYATEKVGDEHNKPFCPNQERVANGINQIVTGTDAVIINPKLQGRINTDYQLSLDDRVQIHFSRIVEQKQVEQAGVVNQYKSIELVVASNSGGGYKIS